MNSTGASTYNCGNRVSWISVGFATPSYQEALPSCSRPAAITRSRLPFDTHPSRSERQQLLRGAGSAELLAVVDFGHRRVPFRDPGTVRGSARVLGPWHGLTTALGVRSTEPPSWVRSPRRSMASVPGGAQGRCSLMTLPSEVAVRTSSSRSNLGGGSAVEWCGSRLRGWSADVRARLSVFVGVVTQLDTHLALLSVRGISALQLSSPGLGIAVPVSQINSCDLRQ